MTRIVHLCMGSGRLRVLSQNCAQPLPAWPAVAHLLGQLGHVIDSYVPPYSLLGLGDIEEGQKRGKEWLAQEHSAGELQ